MREAQRGVRLPRAVAALPAALQVVEADAAETDDAAVGGRSARLRDRARRSRTLRGGRYEHRRPGAARHVPTAGHHGANGHARAPLPPRAAGRRRRQPAPRGAPRPVATTNSTTRSRRFEMAATSSGAPSSSSANASTTRRLPVQASTVSGCGRARTHRSAGHRAGSTAREPSWGCLTHPVRCGRLRRQTRNQGQQVVHIVHCHHLAGVTISASTMAPSSAGVQQPASR